MIYVPILKTRKEEMKILRNMNYCFSEDMIPLIEILNDQYNKIYLIDPITNEFIYEQHGKTRRRVIKSPTESDIITLDYINSIRKGNLTFIDYFRFTTKKYGNNIKFSNVELAWKLSNDVDLYKKRLMCVSNFSNFIPVVSIKHNFEMDRKELNKFIIELQKENNRVALRITEDWIDEYSHIISNTLRCSDYLLFDIGEQNPESKFIELEEITDLNSGTNVLLLNSPRKADVSNGAYETHGWTNLINNSAKDMVEEYSLDGYGDYCGLKDVLPANSGSFRGAAIALFYDYNRNSFYSYVYPDTSQSIRGYKEIIPLILADKGIFDPDNDCPAFARIANMGNENSGNWSTWNNIIATRYIHQIYKYS